MATTLTAAAATALVLLLLIPLSANPLTATVLVFLMGLTGFTVNPVVTALAMRFAGGAPTLTSALSTSAFNTGIAAGSAIAGTALESSLGLTGPPLVGTDRGPAHLRRRAERRTRPVTGTPLTAPGTHPGSSDPAEEEAPRRLSCPSAGSCSRRTPPGSVPPPGSPSTGLP
ncbi:hypothetical protein [Streptomyces sp. NPDC003996]